MAKTLGNAKGGNSDVFNECSGTLSVWRNPFIRFLCANQRYEYIAGNEAAPGDPNRRAPNDPTKYQPYAGDTIGEDWADAVAYTVYPEYGTKVKFRAVGPIRKAYVEVLMGLIP